MTHYFSPTTIGFYSDVLKPAYLNAGTWPDDAIPVSDEIFSTYIQEGPQGKTRGAIDGMPAWVDIAQPTQDEIINSTKLARDRLLNNTDWLVIRHRDQIDSNEATSLTADKYSELLTYRSALRNIPEQPGFPTNITWPTFTQ